MSVPVLLRWIGPPRAWSSLRCARGIEGDEGAEGHVASAPDAAFGLIRATRGIESRFEVAGPWRRPRRRRTSVTQGRDAAFDLIRATFRMCRSPGKRSAPGVGRTCATEGRR